ncbi:hypothetical protein NDU88_008073 [Pleurodeles waltl]|uniref:Uncharacterized protein n=1 Tax=Pleurodeles waltl TaxID=8319 RepID=A0AAV7RWY0_PLEWA|nr:hypothetical protein NDU88_008073 [Pleurodeles waltl]
MKRTACCAVPFLRVSWWCKAWEEGPGEPSRDCQPDPEALQDVSGDPEKRTLAAGLHKSHSQRMWEGPEAEDGFRRSADAEPEECNQLKEDGAKSGHALESLATPGTESGR